MYQNNQLNNRIPSAADVLYGQPKEPPKRDWRYTCQSKTLKRNALSTECFYNADNRLQAKIERQNGLDDEFIYQFDEDGHLLQVVRNGLLEEEYKYNKQGQRTYQKRRYNGVIDITTGDLHYNETGQLIQAGHASFAYDANGALSARRDPQGLTRYYYGDDTLLDGVILSGGEKIGYEYDEESPDGMARRLKGGRLTTTYRWLSVCKLEAYLDYEHSLYYSFSYHDEGWLERLKITFLRIAQPGWKSHDYLADIVRHERRTRLHKMLNSYGGGLELWCGCDQVGTPKLFTDRHGRVVKEMEFDSFGNLRGDSNPDLFIPIGFAGGLADPDTGLVRFGWRDYDACVGRFTAPDPARDMRGDGDLYDYCVDDPISRVDPTGLEFSPAAAIAGGESHKGISHPFGAPHSAGGIAYHRAAPRGEVGAGRGGGNAVLNTGKPTNAGQEGAMSGTPYQAATATPTIRNNVINKIATPLTPERQRELRERWPDPPAGTVGRSDEKLLPWINRQYSDLAEQVGKETGVDGKLLLGLTREESWGMPRGTNPTSSSRGLGHMLTGTADYIAGIMGIQNKRELYNRLDDPEVSLYAMSTYLVRIKELSNINDDRIAILGYTMGHNAAIKAVNKYVDSVKGANVTREAWKRSMTEAQRDALVQYVIKQSGGKGPYLQRIMNFREQFRNMK